MQLEFYLDTLHQKAVKNKWLRLFSAITRGLLAFGFIIPGLKKVANLPFVPGIPPTHPIGYFFDGFFQATEYYIFVGIAQVLAGVLLLFARTAALGAVLYFPIILNIFFITVSLNFKGTWLITSLMLLANLYLLCWEYDKWKTLLPGFQQTQPLSTGKNLGFFRTILATIIASSMGFGLLFLIIAIFKQQEFLLPLIVTLISLLVSLYFLSRYKMSELE